MMGSVTNLTRQIPYMEYLRLNFGTTGNKMKLWKSSVKRLHDPRVHQTLKTLFDAVVADWPFHDYELQISSGYRTPGEQRKLFNAKPPRTRTLNSRHMEGEAIDIILYWKGTEDAIWDRYSYAFVAGYIWFIADSLGIKVTWGADWNRNMIIKEEENWEIDFVHWEVG